MLDFRIGRLICFLAVAVPMLPAFGKTACEVLPIDDAVVVLSQNAQQKDMGSAGCAYEVSTPQLVLMVTPPQEAAGAKDSFAQMKQTAKQAGATVKDENGISPGSFSLATKDTQVIYVMKGGQAFSLSLSNAGSSTPLPDLLDKMRNVAKRAASRL
jgi:hypothetical protein